MKQTRVIDAYYVKVILTEFQTERNAGKDLSWDGSIEGCIRLYPYNYK